MKTALPFKTLDQINKLGYKLTYYYNYKTKCFIRKDGGIFVDGREMIFSSPTAALKYLKRQRNL